MRHGKGFTTRMTNFRRDRAPPTGLDGTSAARKLHEVKMIDSIDAKMGFDRFDSGPARIGWLVNFQPTTIDLDDESAPQGNSAVDFYFLNEEGGYFKSTIQYDPYFYVKCHGREGDVEDFLKKKLEGTLKHAQVVLKEDLSLAGHLLGRKAMLIMLEFCSVADMQNARRILNPIIAQNSKLRDIDWSTASVQQCIEDVREHDVPYHVRVSIDLDVRVGKWYSVAPQGNGSPSVNLIELTDRVERADPVVMAFDIETTKLPLKFPDAKIDKIMMISYMIDGRGFLITNREIVSQDIEDFEYSPKPELYGPFTIFNEPDERALLLRFFTHIVDEQPTVIATFNGDGFDWPFVDARAKVHGMDMRAEIGFAIDAENEYKSTHCVHMDCFRWVKRDSYLPQGSQGLKAVTTAKLGYNPLEIDPELMYPYASERPQVLAEYSVSDAVATYYLYMKYVHPFIFSLCNIIPLRPDEVLRKGTGTLCEMLLMVQAYVRNILLPHKHSDPPERYYNGHLVESETYVGGHVESLEAGVFRDDIPTHFDVETNAVDELLAQLDDALRFTVVTELQKKVEHVVNYDAVREEIRQMLISLKEKPKRVEEPLIYHVDVASMYPNIMTSNRLQPDSMKSERDCAICDYNVPDKICDRRLKWAWRGEYFPAKRDEILMLQQQLKREQFPLPKHAEEKSQSNLSQQHGNKSYRTYEELSQSEQLALMRQRVSDYSRKVYHKLRDSETVEREAIICQRENPFYVNTVRDFRDRRYKYKGDQKVWKQKLGKSKTAEEREYAKKMVILYDSLQLAHKVILNSFYGYVMRKGSRWYSMEMAGVTCLTGATIIQLARSTVEKLGRPLELDTDGIWCILPKSFPGDFEFEMKDGKKIPFAYPCVMLNHLVHEKFTNNQYHTWNELGVNWEVTSDNSIFFEVDGPYKAMMLPSSREEGKGLKKRYAVFNLDGSLAELKGFEMKRRGELQLIKTFQTQLFSQFLKGGDLKKCYDAVAKIANSWLDVLDSKGSTMEDVDLMNLISENKSMSKSLKEYGSQKSSSITTARRLAEFLGHEMVKDKGLACKFIISAEPSSEPVTNRAVPIQIFGADLAVKQQFLRRWLKKPQLDDCDPRSIIDWKYYGERLGATIQKLIVIPAARQGIPNPVLRVPPPQWLIKRLATEADPMKQQTIGFAKVSKSEALWGSSSQDTTADVDIEDLPGSQSSSAGAVSRKSAVVSKRKKLSQDKETDDDEDVSIDRAPNPDIDYVAWLQYMKKVWAKQLKQKAARQQLFGGTARRTRGIHGMLRQQTESAWRGAGGVWQIIRLAPTADPGKVRAMAQVNGRLQTVYINVKRQVFVQIRDGHHMSSLSTGITATPTPDYILPSGHTSKNLWMLVMPEQQYKDELLKSGGLFRSRAIEHVYESHVSDIDRALLKLGVQCKLSGTAGLLGKGLDSGFELDWLTPVTPGQLKDGVSDIEAVSSKMWQNMDYVCIQHYEVHGRHVVVFLSSWISEVTVIELVPKRTADNSDWAGLLAAEFVSQLERYQPDQPFFEFPSAIQMAKTEVFETPARFWSTANKIVCALMSSRGGSVVAVVSCERGINWMHARLRALAEVPVAGVTDSATTALPSIGWQLHLARRVAKEFLRSQYTLESMRVMACHANIPLGNLPVGEDIRQVVDIIFARRLEQAKHVLWWGDSARDQATGGDSIYEVDAVLADTTGNSKSASNISGIYPHVCLDMSVSNLVVNTILASSYLAAADGFEPADPDFVAGAFSPSAWHCLVNMTKEWWTRASAGDVAADQCILQLAGWLSSPVSRLWSSRLAHQVSALSDRALTQLANELRKFGTRVIHSKRYGQRIVLSTTKKSAPTAIAFGGLVVKEVKSKDMFLYLDISVNEVWDFLVWMDTTNYGGRVLTTENELKYVSSWEIAEYLPSLLQEEFDEWVMQFMMIIAEAKDAYVGFTHDETHSGSSQNTATVTEYTAGIPIDFMKGGFIRLEKPLQNRVRQLKSRAVDAMSRRDQKDTFQMPQRAGSSVRKRESPVLAFVKTLMAVYQLTHENTEYIKLRRELLSELDVGDFDSASEFVNPAAKLVVADVVCLSCMACVDVNVCHPENDDSRNFVFGCTQCGAELDRVFLEEKLVQMLMAAISQYQVQDLKCMKCGKLRPNNMAEYCPCSGRFKNLISRESMLTSLGLYRHVGRYFDLRLLNDLIAQY